MPGKLKKFCGLSKYVKTMDKDLYQALDDLCLLGLFNTRNRGVTFLFPSDKAYRKKIVNMAYSNTPEKAVDMFKALLLSDHLPKCDDFKKKQDDIPNFLRKKLDVTDVSSTAVKLKSGHKLELEKSYVSLRNGDQAAVYKLSGKGELPLTGAASTGKYAQPSTRGGGYSGGASELYDMTKFVEKQFANGDDDAYKKILTVVYKHVIDNENEKFKDLVYNSLCATEIATFYNILKPYGRTDSSTNVDMGLVSKLKSLCANWNGCDPKLFAEKWQDNRDAVIKAGRGETDAEADRKANCTKQTSILKESKTVMEYKDAIKTAYINNTSKLEKDLLSVYCYLAIIQDDQDRDYFKNCFCPAMEFLFADGKIDTTSTDIAGSMTLYGNLLKSDAFKYIPTLADEKLSDEYKDLDGELPPPTSVRELFTIERNSTKMRRGGASGCDPNSLV